MSNATYSMQQQQQQQGSDEGHGPSSNHSYNTNNHHVNSSSNNHGGSSGSATRPSLPGLDSFMSATFPPLNNMPSYGNGSNNNNNNYSSSSPTTNHQQQSSIPAGTTTAPGLAYLYGRGGDRRGSLASSSGLSDTVSTPSSLVFAHHHGGGSPGGGGGLGDNVSVASSSRPGTSNGSVVGGYAPPGLPNAFGGLHLRGGAGPGDGGNGDDNASASAGNPNNGGTNNNNNGGETDPRKLRQLWNTWLNTPLSSASEKDTFASGMASLNYPSSNNNSTMSAVPPHLYSPTKQGHMEQGQQGSYALQKSMSLPAIRTPSGGERRSMPSGADLPTPRVPNNQS